MNRIYIYILTYMSLFNIINKNYVFSFFMKLYIPFLKLLTGVIRAHINMTDIYKN